MTIVMVGTICPLFPPLFPPFFLALKQAPQADIEAWEKKYISYTVRKKRYAFFKGGDSQNMGKSKAA